jgi:glutamate dehydrogenase/leucine dehydrogenase
MTSPSLRMASTTADTNCHKDAGKPQEVGGSRCRSMATGQVVICCACQHAAAFTEQDGVLGD